jgi:apolipoprotein N-acyltransferase
MVLLKIVYDKNRAAAILFFPTVIVAAEYLESNWLFKFPFMNIGYAQVKFLQLIQCVDIVGVWGITFLIAFVNIILFRVGYASSSKRSLYSTARYSLPVCR